LLNTVVFTICSVSVELLLGMLEHYRAFSTEAQFR
jgi:hypothetical protein